MLGFERFSQQRIVLEINHAGGEIVAGTPVAMYLAQGFLIERSSVFSSRFHSWQAPIFIK
jgi:hypothetical protein